MSNPSSILIPTVTRLGAAAPLGNPVPYNPNNVAALASNLWTYEAALGDEFITYDTASPNGINHVKWSNGYYPSSKWGTSGPIVSGLGAQVAANCQITSSPGNAATGTITGFTGASCLQLTATSPGTDGYTYSTGGIVSNPTLSYSGGYEGIGVYPGSYIETRVLLQGNSSGNENYYSVWLPSTNVSGELDLFENIGSPFQSLCGHFHYDDYTDPNYATGSSTPTPWYSPTDQGRWFIMGAIWGTNSLCTWFANGSSSAMGSPTGGSGDMNPLPTGGESGPFYWILSIMPVNSEYTANYIQIPGLMLVDYVRVFSPA